MILVLSVPQSAVAGSLPVPALLADDGYTETLTASLALDGGGYAQVQIAFTNTGPGSGRAVCRGLVVSGALNRRAQEVVSRSDWTFSPSPYRLSVGACTLTEAPLTFTWKNGGGELRAVIDPAGAPLALPGLPSVREAGFEAALLAEAAPAQGVWSSKVTTATGARATLEHTLATVPPAEMGRRWYRLRSTDDGHPVTALIYLAGKSDAGSGWLIEDGKARALPGVHAKAAWLPDGSPMTFAFADGQLHVTPTAPVASYAPLRELGVIGRVLGAIVGDPLLTVARVSWNSPAGVRYGVVEVTTFR